MVRNPTLSQLLELSAAERVELAQDLWDSVLPEADAWAPTDAQRAVLEQRLAAYEQATEAGADWASVKQRIERQR